MCIRDRNYCTICGKELGMLSSTCVRCGETNQMVCSVCAKLFQSEDERKRIQLLEIMEKSKYLTDREGFKVYLKAKKEELAERNKKYVCCGQPMLFCGKHEFQKGSMDFFTGSLGNIVAGSMEMAVFQFEVCGQYKFYDPRVVERRQGQTVVCACGREYPRYMLRCPECGAENEDVLGVNGGEEGAPERLIQCPECGHKHNFYDLACPECG